MLCVGGKGEEEFILMVRPVVPMITTVFLYCIGHLVTQASFVTSGLSYNAIG